MKDNTYNNNHKSPFTNHIFPGSVTDKKCDFEKHTNILYNDVPYSKSFMKKALQTLPDNVLRTHYTYFRYISIIYVIFIWEATYTTDFMRRHFQ